jgi:hypothetical protein
VVESDQAMTDRTPHPTISDVAMQLASRSTPQRMVKAALSDDNAKSEVKVTVEVSDPDPGFVTEHVHALYSTLRALHPRENENGAA